MPAEVTRRIHFYNLTFSKFDSTVQQLVEIGNPLSIFQYVRGLPARYDVNPNRYMSMHDGNDLLMQIDDISATRVRGQFAVKRKNKLPPIEDAGVYSELQLQQNAGLAEIFHFVYNVATSVMGVEFNFFAPRLSKWQDYLTYKASHLVNMIEPEILLSGDVEQTIRRLGRMTAVVVGVHRDQTDLIGELDGSLQHGFEALKQSSNGLELEVVLKLGTRKRDEELQLPWLHRLPQFLQGITNRQALKELKVFAHDEKMGKTVPVDLLADSMVAVRKVATLGERSKSVITERMYEAIEEAYDEVMDPAADD